MSLARAIVIKTAALPPVEAIVRKSFLFRPLVSRFIAGDDLEHAVEASSHLLDENIRISLDYLGENTKSEQEALHAIATYERMLKEIDKEKHVRAYREGGAQGIEPLNISIKLTQCGLDQGQDFAENNYRHVLREAQTLQNFVRIDMESSEYTERTIDIVTRVHQEYKNTGTVLQSYLKRNDEDVDLMIEKQIRTRLVKGAYLEPESVAFTDKAKVDEQYVAQAKRLLSKGFYPALATQDEAIINELVKYVQDQGIDKTSFEFQMLYGIRRDLQQGLTQEGFNVRVYVPFGDSWYPYFTRRLAERPANALFIAKAMFRK